MFVTLMPCLYVLLCGPKIRNKDSCILYLVFFPLFVHFSVFFYGLICVTVFSGTVQARTSNKVYICRMSDCIVGLRLRVMALILLFLSIFLSFPIYMLTLNICVGVFSGIF